MNRTNIVLKTLVGIVITMLMVGVWVGVLVGFVVAGLVAGPVLPRGAAVCVALPTVGGRRLAAAVPGHGSGGLALVRRLRGGVRLEAAGQQGAGEEKKGQVAPERGPHSRSTGGLLDSHCGAAAVWPGSIAAAL